MNIPGENPLGINRLLVIAGAGSYPRLIVQGAKKAGVPQVEIIAIKGSTERATWKAADKVHWITIGSIAAGIRWAGEQGYDGAILAGQLNPLSLFRGRFEPEVSAWLRELKVKNAHSIFTKLIEKFAAVGVKILPASLYMEDHLPGEGKLTNRGLSPEEERDLSHAIAVSQDTCRHDIGQTVMVKSGMVLAVEAFEGTNAAIKRGGRLGGKGSLVFKAARAGHDMRFDIPVIGLKTLKVMKRAGASALVFQAGRLLLLDREAVVEFANRHDIALVGIESGLPHAPTR